MTEIAADTEKRGLTQNDKEDAAGERERERERESERVSE